MNIAENTVIFSITNRRGKYPQLAALWAKFLDKLNINNYIVYCLDEESFNYLNAMGIRCELYQKKPDVEYKKFKGRSAYFNRQYGRISVYKLMIAKELLEQGKNIICADTDALFCRNPLQLISRYLSKYDCLLSVADRSTAFPQGVSKELGFCVCTGFFALKASQKSVDFIDDLKGELTNYSSLQAAINFYLFPYIGSNAAAVKNFSGINKSGWRGYTEAFGVEGLAVKLLHKRLVRRTRRANTNNYVVHVTGPVEKVVDRAAVLYKKLYG